MHLEPLDVARLFVGASVLAFGSYTDWRWRRAPDLLWMVAGGAGLVLLAVQLGTQPWPFLGEVYLAMAGLFALLMYGAYRLGLIAGGADAKALMALAVLLPLPLHLGSLPLRASFLPPAFGVLGNTLVLFLAIPVSLFLVNLARRDLRFPHAFLGLRMPVAKARTRHVWPLEYVDQGQVRTMLMPSRFLWEDEDWDALEAKGMGTVWVTPKVPFLMPLLGGFVLAFFAGDLLGAWIFGLGLLA